MWHFSNVTKLLLAQNGLMLDYMECEWCSVCIHPYSKDLR